MNEVQTQTQAQARPQAQVTPGTAMRNALQAKATQQLFENALGKNAGAFTTSLIEVFSSDTVLQKCEIGAVIREAQKAATLNLPINKNLGFSYIVPYFNKKTGATDPTFQLGYKGLIQLALRTGYYKNINADIVYEGELSGKNKLTGEIELNGVKHSDKVVGYFAYIEFLNGFHKTLYMSVEDIAKHAVTYSKSTKQSMNQLIARAGQPPLQGLGWYNNFDEMAKKTVLRLLISKYGYMSVDMQTAISDDTDGERGSTSQETQPVQEATYTEVEVPSPEEEEEEEEGEEEAPTDAPEAPEPQQEETDDEVPF